jgi:hypothetical protein
MQGRATYNFQRIYPPPRKNRRQSIQRPQVRRLIEIENTGKNASDGVSRHPHQSGAEGKEPHHLALRHESFLTSYALFFS